MKRRNFLRGALGTAVALPTMESWVGTAQAENAPKRLICIYTADGMFPEDWSTSDSTGPFVPTSHMGTLADYASDLIAIRGLRGWNDASNHAHAAATFTAESNPARSISLDQLVANEIGHDTFRKSIRLGVWGRAGSPGASISYAGPNSPIAPDVDPGAVFKDLFSNVAPAPNQPSGIDIARARRLSVLDLVKKDFDDVKASLSREDRSRLSDHADLIRSIEARIAGETGTTMPSSTCVAPPETPLDPHNNDHIPLIMETQIELIAHAFACDLTRVASLQFGQGYGDQRFTWLNGLPGAPAGIGNQTHHTHAHDSPRSTFRWLQRWTQDQIAFLIKRLKELNVFENTLIVWGTELPRPHHGSADDRDMFQTVDRPFMMAGSLGGHYKTGRVENFALPDSADPSTRQDYFGAFLLNIARAFGVNASSFGNGYRCQNGATPVEQGGWK